MSNKLTHIYNYKNKNYNKIRGGNVKIPVGVSNRHVHLTNEDLEILFGENYNLTPRNYLDQPGQYAANETVTLKTDKNIKEFVRVVGPTRKYTQVELLEEDKEYFGINPPVRNSGDLDYSENITIIGPKGQIYKENVCIIANRHIHINTRDKEKFTEDQIVKVEIDGKILDNVHIKIGDNYALAMHINKDDAIKNNIQNNSQGVIKED